MEVDTIGEDDEPLACSGASENANGCDIIGDMLEIDCVNGDRLRPCGAGLLAGVLFNRHTILLFQFPSLH